MQIKTGQPTSTAHIACEAYYKGVEGLCLDLN